MTELVVRLLHTELSVYLPSEIADPPEDAIDDAQNASQTELSVYLPAEVAITPAAAIDESQIPLLPASRIGSGVFHLDRIPPIPITKIVWDGDGSETVDGQDAETDSNIATGQALHLKSNGHVELASAATIGTSRVCGLALIDSFAATSVSYSPDRILELNDWTAITGAVTLTPGALYYLSTNPGKLTTTAPTESGQVVIAVGNALSTTKLAIEIQSPILL